MEQEIKFALALALGGCLRVLRANAVMRPVAAMMLATSAAAFRAPTTRVMSRRFLGSTCGLQAVRAAAADESLEDWRAFRAHLVGGARKAGDGSWAHSIATPEPGCVLLANAAKFRSSQGYFRNGVVLLVEHDDTAGSVGFLLNRATPFTIGDIAPGLGALFARCPLDIGGPVGDGLQFIHQLPDVHGAVEIMRGIYYGGDLQHAAYLLRQQGTSGREAALLFRFFFKYCSWGPGQLNREVQNTTIGALLDAPSPVWFSAATSPAFLFGGLGGGGGRGVGGVNTDASLWRAVWHHMQTDLAGGGAPALMPKEADDVLEFVRREAADPFSDYHVWRQILGAFSTPHGAASDRVDDRSEGNTPACPGPLVPGRARREARYCPDVGSKGVLEEGLLYLAGLHVYLESTLQHPGASLDSGAGDAAAVVARELRCQLDALAAETQTVLRDNSPTAVVEALNTVVFKRHGLQQAEDLSCFPGNPQHWLVQQVLLSRHGCPLALGAIYVMVASRLQLPLSLGLVCAGGQRLLRQASDYGMAPRTPSGRRCASRNVWPLKRVMSQPVEGVLVRVAAGTGVDSGVEGKGGGVSGAEWVYVDVCAQGKLLSGHQAVHWRLNLTEGGLPLLASEDIDSERHASLLAAAADVDVLERVCACVCVCDSFTFLCVHFVYAHARTMTHERTYASAQTHAQKHTRAHKTGAQGCGAGLRRARLARNGGALQRQPARSACRQGRGVCAGSTDIYVKRLGAT